MSKIHFGLGEKVRAYHGSDCNFGKVGVINAFRRNAYEVIFDGEVVPWFYTAEYSHNFLEKVEEYSHNFLEKVEESSPSSATKCDQTTQRKLISRKRINVISGKTQSEMVVVQGHARGVQQFNTRCLGRTTGQAFLAIGQAMCNPGTEIRIAGVDHYLEKANQGHGNRHVVDKAFRTTVQKLIGDLKGFSFTDTHLVYQPIQTVETYVEYKQ